MPILQPSKMLYVLDGALWRRFLNGVTMQSPTAIVLPSMLRDDVLGKLHAMICGPGGHLGEAKLIHRVHSGLATKTA